MLTWLESLHSQHLICSTKDITWTLFVSKIKIVLNIETELTWILCIDLKLLFRFTRCLHLGRCKSSPALCQSKSFCHKWTSFNRAFSRTSETTVEFLINRFGWWRGLIVFSQLFEFLNFLIFLQFRFTGIS